MAVELEFYSVIVPIENVRRVKERLAEGIGRPVVVRKLRDALERGIGVSDPCWYDGQLFREGAMGGEGIVESIDAWRLCGLKPTEPHPAGVRWKDLCVALSGKGVITHPCPWIRYDASANAVSLLSAPETLRVGPSIERGVEAFEAGDYARALDLLAPLASDPGRYGSDKARAYLERLRAKGFGA